MTDQTTTAAFDITRRLVQCPSVTPNEGGALDFLQGLLEDAGFNCTRLPFSEAGTPDVDNLFARWGTGSPHFCFAGHTDVVPVGDEAKWTLAPFSGDVKDGELYGRGAVDMKGSIACFAAAAIEHAKDADPESGSISLLITGDEEGPSINGTIKVLQWMAEHGQIPDHCIVGEPTNVSEVGDSIKIGRRGSISGFLTISGKQGHAAYPHLADNPIPKLIAILARLTDGSLDDGSEHFEPSNLEVTSIDVGNPAVNVIPAQASASFNIRYNAHHNDESLRNWIRSCCEQVTAEMGGSYDLAFKSSGDCFITEPGPLVELLQDAVKAETGQSPALATNGGTSDARFIKDYCPVIEFGLVGRTMHQVDERVPVEELDVLTNIYRRALQSYFGRAWQS